MHSDILPESINNLIEEFAKLPSIGPKTAERLVFYLLKNTENIGLGDALLNLKEGLLRCSECQNFASEQTCKICKSTTRNSSLLCVVAQPLDVVAIEKTGLFRGKYYVLHGLISPIDGIGPEDIGIPELLKHIEKNTPEEVILATNPNLEGETTALYIVRQLQGSSTKITKLAHGLPVGGDLEYTDMMTLSRALDGRQAF